MREQGATILLVTHSLDMLQLSAQRGILLHDGRVLVQGSVHDGLRAYEQLVFHSELESARHRVRHRISTSEFTLHAARVFGSDDSSLTEVEADVPFGVEIAFHVHRPLEEAVFSVGILNAAGVVCVWNVSVEDGFIARGVEGALHLRVWYPENKLAKGTYEVNFSLREKTSYETLERLTGITSFTVTCAGRARGVLKIPAQWKLTMPSQTNHDERHAGTTAVKGSRT
jgi:hypothetical protein